jgi:hypothetical protein
MSQERPTEPQPEQVPTTRPSPKRGAFPTPASEIEQATPYLPPPQVDDPDPETAPPADPDDDGSDDRSDDGPAD